ncbi:hypothetical protein GCM10007859_28560 [Brevundimonas denitrificans]|uniref:Uncharacterized protein n=1 Tax=Brevundimonas denitrificans TaxID=1443434 RepID=A0ABQ6BME6_9CAUL|nr:hypothetical protein GCM10007859_28560 [Brevundimonas denitrificans]
MIFVRIGASRATGDTVTLSRREAKAFAPRGERAAGLRGGPFDFRSDDAPLAAVPGRGAAMDIERILSWLLILVPAVILAMAAVMILKRKR